MERLNILDPSRRPRHSCKVVVASPALDHEIFVLRRQAVTLTAAGEHRSTASPMAVGQVLQEQLRILPHQLWITRHRHEDFFIRFNLPAHRNDVFRLGSITVDGTKLFIRPWHEHAHAVTQKFNLHVRIVIEDMPQHFWSVAGAEEALGCRVDRLDSRTQERDHTKSFACWIWVWDVGLIPTKHTFWVMPGGAGHVEEMLGYSPPGRAVATPPTAERHDILIHIDLVEDWIPYPPRSPPSGQSGLPFDDSDDEDRPMPRLYPGTWKKGTEDGQKEPRQIRKISQAVDSGCRGMPRGERRRDGDDGDNGGRWSWKDTLLGQCRADKNQVQ